MTNLIDAAGYTLKTLREQFVPIFEARMVPFFAPLMAAGQHPVNHSVA